MSDITADNWSQPRTTNPKAWWILATILAVEIMDILDATIVNVAIPSIRGDLGSSSAGLQWIVGGYALAFAVGLITGGRLGDIYGRKRMLLIGIVVFTLTSLMCGLAPSTESLIFSRLLQGFGAAIMIPQGFGLIRESFSDEDLPSAFAFWGPAVSIGAVLGPVIGGLLIEANAFDTDWRAVFLVNVPIGIIAFIATQRVVPDVEKDPDAPGLDIPGALIMAVAVGLLIYPMIEGHEADWPAWIFVMFAAGLATLLAFAKFEGRRDKAGKTTLIEPSLFHNRVYVAGTTIIAVFFAALAGLLIVMTLYLQIDQKFTPIHAGLTLIPWSIGTAFGGVLANKILLPKIGRSVLHIGVGVMAAGVIGVLLVLSSYGHNITTLELAGPLIVLGFGLGLVASPLFNFVMADLSDQQLGSGSGVMNALQQFGSAAGVAIIGTVFFAIADDDSILAGFETSLVVILVALAAVAALAFLLPKQTNAGGQ